MSEDYLYTQLFKEPESKRLEQKQSNADVLNSLFAVAAPTTTKASTEMNKKKSQEELTNYISRMNAKSSEKMKKDLQRLKDQRTLPPKILKEKRAFESSMAKAFKPSSKPDPYDIPVLKQPTNKYMPNIVDPFAKPEPKPKKKPQHALRVEKQRERPSKVESKHEKIQRKINSGVLPPQQKPTNHVVKETVKPLVSSKAPSSQSKPVRSEKPLKTQPSSKSNKQIDPKKKRKRSSSSSSSSLSSSSSSSASSPSQQSQDWRKELEKITGYNPRDAKFRERDRMQIHESGVNRIFGEDKYSLRMGLIEEEEDLRRQQELRRRKMHKHKHKHHH